MVSARELENRFLGSLLGLAIGDALGMPVSDLPIEETRARFGEIREYLPRDAGTDAHIPAGEITDETETVLCVVESMTLSNGRVDTENIAARLRFLVEGPSRHWMPEEIRDGIEQASIDDGLVPESTATDGSLAVAVRGVPIGLMHSVGAFDRGAFVEETRLVSRLSHGGVGQQQLVLDVAVAVMNLIRDDEIAPIALDGDLGSVAGQRDVIAGILSDVREGKTFDDVVLGAVNCYRPADSAGAIAGALAGAAVGAAAIPQPLIDGLEARVYLSLAAPWFYRTATRRAGTLIDLRQV
ncbi:MAG TPA: ADP-ribosylglycohydrolase family protein [Thermomicrobiales bacterium]|nr:ADP-ribosylglycohydrolase family protein [Thermomicrobiales bacterium]